jgi:hypothetical protein
LKHSNFEKGEIKGQAVEAVEALRGISIDIERDEQAAID